MNKINNETKNFDSADSIIFSKKTALMLVVWGLILEFPIRYLISPDPWIHGPDHWYFMQPNRILIEILFVVLAFLPFLFVTKLKQLTFTNFDRYKINFLIGGCIIGLLIFSAKEWPDILEIDKTGLWQYVPLWFITGIFIGIGQELTFRGLIYTGLTKYFGLKTTIIISTLCFTFGAIHGPRMYVYFINGHVTVTLMLMFIFILTGLFFAWVRQKTNNILIPALLHGMGNAVTWGTYVVLKLY